MDKVMTLIGSGKRLSSLLNIVALMIVQAADGAGYETNQVAVLGALNGILMLVGIGHAVVKGGK